MPRLINRVLSAMIELVAWAVTIVGVVAVLLLILAVQGIVLAIPLLIALALLFHFAGLIAP